MSEADDIREFTGLVGVDDGIYEMTPVEVSMFLMESTDPHNGKLRRTRDPVRIRQLERAHEKGFISAYSFCKLTGTDLKTFSPKVYKYYRAIGLPWKNSTRPLQELTRGSTIRPLSRNRPAVL